MEFVTLSYVEPFALFVISTAESRMKLLKNQPFWTAVILHLMVLLGLFLVTILQAFRPKQAPHVFEVVSLPELTEQNDTREAEPVPQLNLPDIQPMRDMPNPQSEPTLAEPVRPESGSPRTAAPKLISKDQFDQVHGKPTPRQSTRPTPRNSVPEIRIDTPQIHIPPTAPISRSESVLTPAQVNQLSAYQARLRAKLNAAWVEPANIGGLRLKLVAVFDVAANGRITNIRLNPGSGNRAYDQSVLEAFRKVGSTGATPTGRTHTFSIGFALD